MTAQNVRMPKKRKRSETKESEEKPSKKKTTDAENDLDGGESDDDGSPDKKAKTEPEEPFCIKKFLVVLDKGGDLMKEFQKFIEAADSFASGESTVDVVKQYLDATDGNFQSISALLYGVKTGSRMHTLVYQVLERLVSRLPEDFRQYVNTALVSAQQMLQKYSRLMHMSLCRTAKANHAKAALRLLTSIVTLGPEGARYVTSVVNFETTDFTTWINTRNRRDTEDVRTCAVFFLMSVLVVGSNSVARQVLQAKGLINSIFPGLPYDRASFICSFLSTFQTKVVENTSFTKTIKLKMLNDKSLRYVTHLLSWEGPKSWTIHGKWNKYKAIRGTEKEDPEAVLQASEEDVELVQSTAYNFLTAVCCSHKYGILFRDPKMGQSRQNMNHVITSILLTMEHPYEHERCCSFVVEVLKVAPDQIGYYLHGWRSILMYATAATAEKLINLYTQVVEVQDLDSTVWAMGENVPEKVCRLILYFSLLSVASNVTEARSVQTEEDNIKLQLAHMRFIAASLRKVQSALDHAESAKSSVSAAMKTKLRRILCQDVWKNVPPTAGLVKEYCNVVKKATSKEPETEGPSLSDYATYCSSILDVLDLYRLFSQDYHSEYDWKVLSKLAGVETDVLDAEVEDQCLQLRAIGLVLEACPASEVLMISDGEQKSAFCHLLELFARRKEGVIGKSAASLISKLLCNLNVLEGYSMEIDIWMEKFRQGQCLNLVHLLLAAVQLVVTDSNRLNSKVMRCVMNKATAAGGQSAMDLWSLLEQNEAAAENAKEMESFGASTYFSPLVPAAMECIKHSTDAVHKSYVYSVIKTILHHQQRPVVFCNFLHRHSQSLSKLLLGYVSIWSSDTLPVTRPMQEEGVTEFFSAAEYQLECMFLDILYAPKHAKKMVSSTEQSTVDVTSCSLNECRSLFYQAMLYARRLLGNKRTMRGFLSVVQVLKDVFERAIELRTEKEEPSALLDALLRDDMTLSVYLHDVQDGLYLVAQDYSSFVLDTIIQVMQCTSSIPKGLQASLCFLKDRSLKKISAGTLPREIDSSKVLQAFSGVFNESDILALLQAVGPVPSRCKKNVGPLLSTWLTCTSKGSEQDTPLLSAEVIQNMLSSILESQDNVSLLEAFLRFLEFRPVYVFALRADDLKRLLEDQTSAGIDIVNFLMKHNIQHRQDLQQLIPGSFKPMVSHLSMASLAGFLRSLCLGLTRESAPRKLVGWLTKTFLVLPKRACALKKGVTQQVLDDMTSCLSALMKLGQLGNDSVAKLVEILSDTTEHELQLALLNTLCRSMSEELFDGSVCDSCLHTLLQCVASLASSHADLSEHVLQQLQEVVATAKVVDQSIFARVVRQDGLWPQFIKDNLKTGFRSQEFGHTSFELLSVICQKVYSVGNIGDINPALCRVYMMMFGHSRFLPLMLDTEPAVQERKDKMLELMAVLVQCDPTLCNVEHIPIFLSAYGASLSIVDQRILYLMFLYEKNGVDVCNFKPFLWGPSAVSFYSLHKKASVSLLKQPKSEEVLNLINEDKMAATVLRFPLHLQLDVVPLESIANRSLYDPRFLLPLLFTLLTPESLVNCRQIVETRCLALILMSLSSEVFEVRCLGCNLVMMLHHHLQGSRFTMSALWLSVLETLRNAATVTCPHVPCLVSGYLVSAIDVISNPGHFMFNAVADFLLAKPVLDIENMPDFYKMFYNYRLEHYMKRNWHLEVMVDYMRCGLDFHISKKRYIFNILLTFFMSPLCPKNTKELILKLLIAAAKIPKAARILCREQGLMMWLPAALERNSEEKDICELLFEAVHHVWKSSFVKTVRVKDLKAAKTRKQSSVSKDEEASEESADEDKEEESAPKEEDEAAMIRAKRESLRYYEYFPYEFLLMLFSTRKYIMDCHSLDAFTKFTEQLSDMLCFVRSREASGKSKAAQNCCLPNRDIVLELLNHWRQLAAVNSADNYQQSSQAIASVCHHWQPDDTTQPLEWLEALDFSLQHGAESINFNEDLLAWVLHWLEGSGGPDRAIELVNFQGGHCLERLLARVHWSLGEIVASGDDRPIVTSVVLQIADLLFSKAAKVLAKAQCDLYRKQMVLLRVDASLPELDRALGTSVLFSELLLRVTKAD
ncbi:nucleolar pre-ribosomal-associated protein 1 [Rhipicephalus sanguineus]|uniref:nucleolar pre-ribosomal-associated protein 1 n=1 Tax=Rhipicephalus sanguineus TaxID=34632 RepID=UPI0020C5288A|nr:nucleolar pre-ribosomal-associated protein 1 [Rhipicephalus sanguineus]